MSHRPAWTPDVPYVFAIYADADADEVHREIAWLHEQEFNVRWEPEMLSDGAWSQEVADAIEQASLVLNFISPRSESATGFHQITEYATTNSSLLLDVHLGQPQAGSQQGRMETTPILKYDMTDDEYRDKLITELKILAPDTRIQPISTPAMPIMDEKGAPNLLQHGLIALIILALGILAYIFMAP